MTLVSFRSKSEPPPAADAPATPADALTELLAERARIEEEIRRFDPVVARRVEAGQVVANVDAAIRALDDAEAMAWTNWAGNPAGEAPQPRLGERRALAQKRVDAQADLTAATGAEASIEHRLTALIHKIQHIEASARAIRIARVLETARDLHREALALAAESGLPLMQIAGLRLALADQMRLAGARRDDAAEAAFGAAIEQLSGLKPPSVLPDAKIIETRAAEWKRKL